MATNNGACGVSLPPDLARYTQQGGSIGEGALGIVFRGRDTQTRQPVVLKHGTEKSSRNDDIELKREIYFLSMLRGKNQHIIRLVDYYRPLESGRTILVLEGCACDLRQIMRRRRLTKIDVKTITKHILEGLSYLEEKNIMHCDLKPNNILLSREGFMKICDFGSARSKDRQAWGYFAFYYASIELLLGTAILDFKTDAWSFGCIFVELITRRGIFPITETAAGHIEKVFDVCGTFEHDGWKALRPHLDEHTRNCYFPRNGTINDFVTRHVGDEYARYLICHLLLTDRRYRWSGREALGSKYMRSEDLVLNNLRHLIIQEERQALRDASA